MRFLWLAVAAFAAYVIRKRLAAPSEDEAPVVAEFETIEGEVEELPVQDDSGISGILDDIEEVVMGADEVADRIIEHTAQSEGRGRYDAINPNGDGAGLSFGLIQFTQKGGALGQLLGMMRDQDADQFAGIFGSESDRLVSITQSKDQATRMSMPLWAEPWVSRFREAGNVPAFQAAQRKLAKTAYYDPMFTKAQQYSITSERGLSLLFDTAVQQGVKRLGTILSRADARRESGSSERDFLELVAEEAVQAAPEKWAGDIRRRRYAILADAELTDEAVV